MLKKLIDNRLRSIVIFMSLLGCLFLVSQVQAAASDPEAQRAVLRGILETQQQTAAMMGSTELQETTARALDQLEQLTWEELQPLVGVEGLSDLQSKQNALNEQLSILEAHVPNLGTVVQKSSQSVVALSSEGVMHASTAGLTDADYGDICSTNDFGSPPNGPNRADPDANQGLVAARVASDIALVVAEGVRDAADIGCNTVVVLGGFGGNPQSPLCLISSAVYIVAKGINEGLRTSYDLLTFCDATIDGAEIEGAYERASDIYGEIMDIHTDLAAHDTDIKADISAHDTDIKADISAHDTEIKSNLAVHDTNISNKINLHHTQMSAQLQQHDADIKAKLDLLNGKLDVLMARQLEIVRLLVTPQGKRKTDVPACDGGACKWPNKK